MRRLIILTMMSITASGFAQDIHFTQTSQVPLMVDPSLTGTFDGSMRASLNYRGQWKAVTANYQTYALQFDHRLYLGQRKRSFLAYGLYAYRDVAGSLKLGNTRVTASISSALELAQDHLLSIGLSAGYGSFGMDLAQARWRDGYYNGLIGVPSTAEVMTATSDQFADISAGMTYWWRVGDEGRRKEIKAGVGLHHINRPKFQFLQDSESFFRMRMTAHFDGDFDLNSKIGLLPSVQYSLKGPHSEFVAGLMMRYRLKPLHDAGDMKRVNLMLGVTSRFNTPVDAVAPMLGMEMHDFLMLMTYDVNVSGLSGYTNLRGGFEISLRYIFPGDDRVGRSSI